MKFSVKTIILILAHLFVFNFIFTYRHNIADSNKAHKEWNHGYGNFQGKLSNYLKLYYSNVTDEAYYYEWSTLVLGKNFEQDYPFADRKASPVNEHFFDTPHLQIPYRDISFEYPPLMAVPLLASRLLSHDYLSFTQVLAFFLCMAYMTCLGICYLLWKEIPTDQKIAWNNILWLSLVSLMSLGQLFVTRLDVIPALLYLLAIYSFVKEKYSQSVLWIVLGIFTKGYSLLLAPMFGITLLLQKKYRPLISSLLLVIILSIGISGALAYYTQGHYWDSYRFHAARGIQIESFYASIPYLSYLLFNSHLFVFNDHFCVNMHYSGIQHLIQLSKIMPPLLFFVFYFIFWKKTKKLLQKSNTIETTWLVNSSLLLICIFLFSFKVFSPQFLIWLIPLVFLSQAIKNRGFQALWVFTLILTQVIYPNFYWMLADETYPAGVIMIVSRNLALLIIFVILFRNWKSSAEAK